MLSTRFASRRAAAASAEPTAQNIHVNKLHCVALAKPLKQINTQTTFHTNLHLTQLRRDNPSSRTFPLFLGAIPMPITQDRMIGMIKTTEVVLEHLKALRGYTARTQSETIIQNLNAVAARIHPADAAVLHTIRDHITTTLEILGTDIPEEHKLRFLEEKAHFKVHAKQNERVARYMQRKRLGLVGTPPLRAPQAPQAEPQAPWAGAMPNLGSVTYAEDFVAPPEGIDPLRKTKVFDEADAYPAPIPLTDELVKRLIAEAEAAPAGGAPAVHPTLGYGLPAPGDNYRSRGEAPDVPLPGTKVFDT